jgi:hypothetical protein
MLLRELTDKFLACLPQCGGYLLFHFLKILASFHVWSTFFLSKFGNLSFHHSITDDLPESGPPTGRLRSVRFPSPQFQGRAWASRTRAALAAEGPERPTGCPPDRCSSAVRVSRDQPARSCHRQVSGNCQSEVWTNLSYTARRAQRRERPATPATVPEPVPGLTRRSGTGTGSGPQRRQRRRPSRRCPRRRTVGGAAPTPADLDPRRLRGKRTRMTRA